MGRHLRDYDETFSHILLFCGSWRSRDDSRNSSWDTIPFPGYLVGSRRPPLIESIRLDLSPQYFIQSTAHTIDRWRVLHILAPSALICDENTIGDLEAVILDHRSRLTSFNRSTIGLVKMKPERMRVLAQVQRPCGKNTGCLNWRRRLAYSSASLKSILPQWEYLQFLSYKRSDVKDFFLVDLWVEQGK